MAGNDNLRHFRAIDGGVGKLGKHNFQIKLPEEAENYLLSLSSEDRVSFIRSALVGAVNERKKQ